MLVLLAIFLSLTYCKSWKKIYSKSWKKMHFSSFCYLALRFLNIVCPNILSYLLLNSREFSSPNTVVVCDIIIITKASLNYLLGRFIRVLWRQYSLIAKCNIARRYRFLREKRFLFLLTHMPHITKLLIWQLNEYHRNQQIIWHIGS